MFRHKSTGMVVSLDWRRISTGFKHSHLVKETIMWLSEQTDVLGNEHGATKDRRVGTRTSTYTWKMFVRLCVNPGRGTPVEAATDYPANLIKGESVCGACVPRPFIALWACEGRGVVVLGVRGSAVMPNREVIGAVHHGPHQPFHADGVFTEIQFLFGGGVDAGSGKGRG